jgi:hypothetical protein
VALVAFALLAGQVRGTDGIGAPAGANT